MTAESEDPRPTHKRARVDASLAAGAANGLNAAAAGGGSAAPAAAPSSAAGCAGEAADGHPLLPVPALTGDMLDSEALIPALQQLLGAYEVEFWATLEQLRADLGQPNNAAAAASSSGGLREAWEATLRGEGAAAAAQAAPNGLHTRQQQQQQKQQQEQYGDPRCGFVATGSSSSNAMQQLPSWQEAQQLLQHAPADRAASEQQQAAWRERFSAAASAIAGLEQLASAATMQLLDAQGGLACLCGQHGRWVVRRSAVSIGRSTGSKGDVDVDLGTIGAAPLPAAAADAGGPAPAAAAAAAAAAGGGAGAAEQAAAAAGGGGGGGAATPGAATTAAAAAAASPAALLTDPSIKYVSRLQAQLQLTADGSWSVHNTGRARLAVNGQEVPRGSSAALPHLSLLEVADMPLLFMVNALAVQRAVARTTHLTI